MSSLEKDWRQAAGCQEHFSYHCNRLRKTNNFELQKIHMSICRDREEWFPGREWTASRLKERGKNLVVDLQEIVT